jgi:predicted protein tyrosine phosphatase
MVRKSRAGHVRLAQAFARKGQSALARNVLFVCSQNRLRSPTAEQVFATWPGVVAASGLNHDAENPVTPELVEWANIIFVMERSHRNKLSAKFKPQLHNKRVICLEIPDEYEFMAPQLVQLLKVRVPRHLPSA